MSDEVVETPEVEETPTEETPEAPTVESLQTQMADLQAKLEKTTSDRNRTAKKLKELEKAKPTDETEVDHSEAVAPWKKTSAVAELRAAGLDLEQARRLVGMVNIADVDVDEDGDVIGLENQIDSLKETFPELFNRDAKPPKKPVRKVDTGDKHTRDSGPVGMSEASKAMLGYK